MEIDLRRWWIGPCGRWSKTWAKYLEIEYASGAIQERNDVDVAFRENLERENPRFRSGFPAPGSIASSNPKY